MITPFHFPRSLHNFGSVFYSQVRAYISFEDTSAAKLALAFYPQTRCHEHFPDNATNIVCVIWSNISPLTCLKVQPSLTCACACASRICFLCMRVTPIPPHGQPQCNARQVLSGLAVPIAALTCTRQGERSAPHYHPARPGSLFDSVGTPGRVSGKPHGA